MLTAQAKAASDMLATALCLPPRSDTIFSNAKPEWTDAHFVVRPEGAVPGAALKRCWQVSPGNGLTQCVHVLPGAGTSRVQQPTKQQRDRALGISLAGVNPSDQGINMRMLARCKDPILFLKQAADSAAAQLLQQLQDAGCRVRASTHYRPSEGTNWAYAHACCLAQYGPVAHKIMCNVSVPSGADMDARAAQAKALAGAAHLLSVVMRRSCQVLTAQQLATPLDCRTWGPVPTCMGPSCVHNSWNDVLREVLNCPLQGHRIRGSAEAACYVGRSITDLPQAQVQQLIARFANVKTHMCNNCGQTPSHKLLICSRCRQARYCSKECQRNDYRQHKHFCKPV